MTKSKDSGQLNLDLSKPLKPAPKPAPKPDQTPSPEESPPRSEEPEAPVKPGPRRARLAGKLLAGLAVLLLLAAGGFFGIRHWVLGLVANPAGGKITLEVEKGAGLRQVAHLLAENGIIKWPYAFILADKLHPDRRQVKAGEYTFSPSFSQKRILSILKAGKVVLHAVMIPEGLTVAETLDRLAETGLMDKSRTAELAGDAGFIKKLGIRSGSLEGYLYPDTYHLPRGMAPEAILTLMVHHFEKAWGPLAEPARQLGLSRREAVTLASIIEEEALLDQERPLISAVYHNRLKIGMRLQADPTVIFGLEIKGEFEPPLSHRDLEVDTPYNTYIHTGLPPGPICSPGGASLRAAVQPAEVNHLYFVANGQGGHTFSRTYKSHVNAVRAYKRRQQENRKAQNP